MERCGPGDELGFAFLEHRAMHRRTTLHMGGSSCHSKPGLLWKGSEGPTADSQESQHVSFGTTGSLHS